MREICCKLEDNKQPVCKGEECDKFGGCKYKNICGAKEQTKTIQCRGIIKGKNRNAESKKLQDTLNALERNRAYRRK